MSARGVGARTPVIARVAMVAAAWLCSAPVTAEAALREDFAYAMPVELWAGAPLQWLDLPIAVYREAIDPRLSDLRVLNGKGEVVPFALQRPPVDVVRPAAAQRLPIFPLRGDPGVATAEFSLSIRGDSLEVRRHDAMPRLDAPLAAILIDAQPAVEAIETLTFASSEDADYSVTAVLEVSNDLVDWTAVDARVPLARLRYGGQVFEKLGVTLQPPIRMRFWRLRAQPGEKLPRFDGVAATYRATSVAVDRQMIEAAGRRVAGAAGEYLFDLGAHVPVDRLELELPELNTVAQVEYFARRAPAAPWQPVARTAVHRLQTSAAELRSGPLTIPAQSSRYWRVVVDPRGGGLGAAVPGLRAGWLAHRVVFVARGAAPFELVYGNFAAENAEVALDRLVPGAALPGGGAVLEQPLARVGTPRLAGGVERLHAPPPPGNWRLAMLWAALGVGVLSLAAVAWRLARQMRGGS